MSRTLAGVWLLAEVPFFCVGYACGYIWTGLRAGFVTAQRETQQAARTWQENK